MHLSSIEAVLRAGTLYAIQLLTSVCKTVAAHYICLQQSSQHAHHGMLVMPCSALALLRATAYLLNIRAMQPSERPVGRDRIPGSHLLCSLCCSLPLRFIGCGRLLCPLHKVGCGLDPPHCLQCAMLRFSYTKDRCPGALVHPQST